MLLGRSIVDFVSFFDGLVFLGADGGEPGPERLVDWRKGGAQGAFPFQLRESLLRPGEKSRLFSFFFTNLMFQYMTTVNEE